MFLSLFINVYTMFYSLITLMSGYRAERNPQEDSRARVFRVVKNLVKPIDFEVALFYREREDPPQVTIRIGDKLIFITQGGKLYLLMKDLRWTDYGKTKKPSLLFHPASDPSPHAIRGWHRWSGD